MTDSLTLADLRKGIIIFICLLAIIVVAGVVIWQRSAELEQAYQNLNESAALQSD